MVERYLGILKQFIKEELVKPSWLRRPRGKGLADVSDQVKQWRSDMFKSAKDDVSGETDQLLRKLSSANDIKSMLKAVADFGEEPNEIALDATMLSQAIQSNDIDSARTQLTSGLQKWKTEMMKWSKEDDDSSLTGHPTRSVGAGGTTGKRSMGV